MFFQGANIPRHGMSTVVVPTEPCEGGIRADNKSVGKLGGGLHVASGSNQSIKRLVYHWL